MGGFRSGQMATVAACGQSCGHSLESSFYNMHRGLKVKLERRKMFSSLDCKMQGTEGKAAGWVVTTRACNNHDCRTLVTHDAKSCPKCRNKGHGWAKWGKKLPVIQEDHLEIIVPGARIEKGQKATNAGVHGIHAMGNSF